MPVTHSPTPVPVTTRDIRKWHCGTKFEGTLGYDYCRTNNCVVITNATEAWRIREKKKKHVRSTQGQTSGFETQAQSGDTLFIGKSGKVTHWGEYTGVVYSKEEEITGFLPAPKSNWSWFGRVVINVVKWHKLENPFESAHKQLTVYEVPDYPTPSVPTPSVPVPAPPISRRTPVDVGSLSEDEDDTTPSAVRNGRVFRGSPQQTAVCPHTARCSKLIENLDALNVMFRGGLLSDAEFSAAKAGILNFE